MMRMKSATSVVKNRAAKYAAHIDQHALKWTRSVRQTRSVASVLSKFPLLSSWNDCPSWAVPIGIREAKQREISPEKAITLFQDLPPSTYLSRWLKFGPGEDNQLIGIAYIGAAVGSITVDYFIRNFPQSPTQRFIIVIDSLRLIREVAERVSVNEFRRIVFVRDRSPEMRAAVFNLADFSLVSEGLSSRPNDEVDVNTLTVQSQLSTVPTFTSLADPLLHESAREQLNFMGRKQRLEILDQIGLNTGFAPLTTTEHRVEKFLNDPRPTISVSQPPKLVIAGHDFKFAQHLIRELKSMPIALEIDQWTGHARHDEGRSRELSQWADAVFCEWTLGNAAWYSHNAPSSVRISTRFHMQERDAPFLKNIDYERIAAMIFVADHPRQQVLRDHPIEESRTILIPNTVEVESEADVQSCRDLRGIALVGQVPLNKRIDLAYSTLEKLRTMDPTYHLAVRGKKPDEYDWMDRRPDERRYYEDQEKRRLNSENLREAIEFVPFGDGLFSWYQQQGSVISTSSFEAFHYSLPEGAIHGAIPRSLAWTGADLIYPTSWLAANPSGLALKILEATKSETAWKANSSEAIDFVKSRFEARDLSRLLARVILNS